MQIAMTERNATNIRAKRKCKKDTDYDWRTRQWACWNFVECMSRYKWVHLRRTGIESKICKHKNWRKTNNKEAKNANWRWNFWAQTSFTIQMTPSSEEGMRHTTVAKQGQAWKINRVQTNLTWQIISTEARNKLSLRERLLTEVR